MNPAEIQRQLSNMLQIGTVELVDLPARKCRVQIGNLLTGWLDMPADISANYIRWKPLRVGTQVLLACPAGEVSAGVIVAMLFSNSHNAPSDADDLDIIKFDDGTTLQYNSTSKTLGIDCQGPINVSCTEATISSSGAINVDAANINLGANGEPTVLGNQLARWITTTLTPWLTTHTHTSSSPGNPTSPPIVPFLPADASTGGSVYSTKNRSQ